MKPLSVLIVDDDAMMRISLKSLIAWQEHGYRLIGEASDGEQALEICRRSAPDILITDMKMPRMDGIALLRALQKEKIQMYVIVLSGYDDFQLVREAMRLGAADYLLKLELEPCKLLDVLSNANQTAQQEEITTMQPVQERILRELIGHFYLNETDFAQQMKNAGIDWETAPIWCMLIKAGEIYRFEEVSDEDCYTLQFSVRNIAEEIVGDVMTAYYADGKTGELYVFASVQSQFESTDSFVQSVAERLQKMLLRYLDISCVIGLAQSDAQPESLSRAAREAAAAVQNRFWTDNIIVTAEYQHMEQEQKLRTQMTAACMAFDRQQMDQLLMMAKRYAEVRSLRTALEYAVEVYTGVREAMERLGQDAAAVMPNSLRSMQELLKIKSKEEVSAWLESIERDVHRFWDAERESAGRNLAVTAACTQIEQRFAAELSVQQIAEELELTPGYLSALMKRNTGKNFTEYVTHIRIKRAKAMLRETNDKIYSIALRTGFSDQYYFSRIFKRITGVTPGDWRKGISAEEYK